MQQVMGAGVVALAVLLLVDAGRGRIFGKGPATSAPARAGMMRTLTAVSVVLAAPAVVPPLRGVFFSFCGTCPVPGSTGGAATGLGALDTFLLGAWYYAATVLPVFVLSCALSGAVYVNTRLSVGGILRSFALASVLPLCSCGVVPLGKSVMDRGGTGVRSGLMFIAAAPLLSPIVIGIGASVLGFRYVAVRVVASFLMALSVALVVPRFLESSATGGQHVADRATVVAGPAGGSALLAGWSMLTGLFRYVLYGAVVGAAFTALLPPEFLERVLGAGALSMATTVVAGVPVNLCAGEEILLTAPLAGMGLSMGHAVAFALAGTGICLSALPLLVRALGKRAALAMLALYLTVPFVLGLAIDAVPALENLATLLF